MKKSALMFILTIFLITLVGCNRSQINEDSKKEEVVQEEKNETIETPPVITSFEAFGKSYSSTKDLSEIEKSTDIYDNQTYNSYVSGEYKEVDFANDLLRAYVNQDENVYNYLVSFDENSESGIVPITEEEKIKLQKDLESLREQMELADGETMVIKLEKVTYKGTSSKINKGASFKIKVAISGLGSQTASWNYHTVEVFEEGNKLVAYLL